MTGPWLTPVLCAAIVLAACDESADLYCKGDCDAGGDAGPPLTIP